MVRYSFIIPTIGRKTLHRAVISVITQSDDLEILVVVDSFANLDLVQSQLSGISVKIVQGNVNGVSKLRNLGVKEAKGEWILFLDDDDMLLPGRIKNLENQISLNPDIRFFTSRSLQVTGEYALVRPKTPWSSGARLQDNWYRSSFCRSKMYMATGTWSVRKDLANSLSFNSALSIREDLQYLFSVGERILQSDSIDCVVYHSPTRALNRESFQNACTWTKLLAQDSYRSAVNYFFFEYLRGVALKMVLKTYYWVNHAKS